MGKPISYIARKYIEEGVDFVVARVATTSGSTPRHRGAVMLMREDGHTVGTVGGGLLEHETEKLCRRMLQSKEKHLTYDFILDEKQKEKGALDMGCGGDATIELEYIEAADPGDFVEEFKVRDRVYIFGGGHVAKALEPVLRHVDFETWIIDDREEYANNERFPDAEGSVVCRDFDHCFEDLESSGAQIDSVSYLVIVTRGHRGDLAVLRQALNKPYAYLGMIGSRRKNALLYEQLREEGVSEDKIATVHAPIGLEIGSETPEEIGVSIAAEMILERSKRADEEDRTEEERPEEGRSE